MCHVSRLILAMPSTSLLTVSEVVSADEVVSGAGSDVEDGDSVSSVTGSDVEEGTSGAGEVVSAGVDGEGAADEGADSGGGKAALHVSTWREIKGSHRMRRLTRTEGRRQVSPHVDIGGSTAIRSTFSDSRAEAGVAAETGSVFSVDAAQSQEVASHLISAFCLHSPTLVSRLTFCANPSSLTTQLVSWAATVMICSAHKAPERVKRRCIFFDV